MPLVQKWYFILDLKHAFFSLTLAPKIQEYFAFEWYDTQRGINGQLTWTHLLHTYKNSPTNFEEPMHEDLGEYRANNPDITLLHYIGDLLLAAETKQSCQTWTQNLLQALGNMGYWASAKKLTAE